MNAIAVPATRFEFPNTIQWLLNWFAFFLAFPVIDVFGFSITFYLFVLLFFQFNANGLKFIKGGKGNMVFFVFLASALISTLFHPPLAEDVPIFDILKHMIQISYWIFMALFFKSHFSNINLFSFSKYLFFGLALLSICFYFFPFKLDLIIANVNFRQSRNGFVFNTLSFFPLIFYYVLRSGLNSYKSIILLLFSASLLFSNGRSGFVLIILQILMIGPILYPSLKSIFRLTFVLFFSLTITWIVLEDSPIMANIANTVETVNPRAAALLSKEGNEGNLKLDKSWLIRKLMVDKSLEIFAEYPMLGVGWLNFTRYDSELKSLGDYERLGSSTTDFYNTRSAHNSYAQLLAEGGLIGIISLFFVFYPIILLAIKKIITFQIGLEDLPLIGITTILIYFYAISSLTGTGTWFAIGIAYANLQLYNLQSILRSLSQK